MTAESDKAAQEFLDSIETEGQRQTLTSNGTISAIIPFVRSLGFYASRRNVSSFIKPIVKDQIPLRIWKEEILTGPQKGPKIRIIILPAYALRIRDTLDKDPLTHALRENPAQQLCGELINPPLTAYQLRTSSAYSRLGRAFRGVGIKTGVGGYSRFFESAQDCLTPIWRTDSKYFYPTDQTEVLEKYIRKILCLIPAKLTQIKR